MSTKLTFALGGFAAVLVAVLVLVSVLPGRNAHASPSFISNILSTATTSASIAVTSSTRVLATTTNALGTGTSYTRVHASICNPSSTLVYLNMNADKAASNAAFVAVIAAAAGYNACYEITDRNLYQGSVTASSTNQTSTNVQVTDYVQ